ncbi:glucosidase 2 subunit beta isoform X4 [Hydra vulgaris]|uniref:glucosidase 2 subunit beta isoform X4 n=1 Tax=Hydra vulgaris TaxID=6087 RepID=UPI001F5E4796|nr:glucosidase 2 subunit beta isoform X4 [Hydra vulgaris]
MAVGYVFVVYSLSIFICYLDCSVVTIRGVELRFQSFYNPKQDFTCFDRSNTIPFASINDDYCDCPDGSDEPGTAACPNGKFYCTNIGHEGKYIQSSRVNDGICDCCDGSDEFDSNVVCFNECQKHQAEAAEKHRQLTEMSNIGYSNKQEMIQEGERRKVEKQNRLSTLNDILEGRRLKLEELRAAKEAAEKPETEAKELHKKNWEEVQAKRKAERESALCLQHFFLLDLDKNGWVTYTELTNNPYMKSDNTEDVAKDLLDGNEMVDSEGFVKVWEHIKDKVLVNGRPIPEEKLNAEKIDSLSEEKTNQQAGSEEIEPPAVSPTNEEDVMPDYDEETKKLIEGADAARKSFDDIDNEVKELENERRSVEEYLSIDYGYNNEFAILKDNCYEFTDREYIYKLCPFSKTTQRSKSGGSETDLGKWGNWGELPMKYSTMLYKDGAGCWNGPARSTKVSLSCGAESKLLAVSEPSRCEYAMEFQTPALCTKVASHTEL